MIFADLHVEALLTSLSFTPVRFELCLFPTPVVSRIRETQQFNSELLSTWTHGNPSTFVLFL